MTGLTAHFIPGSELRCQICEFKVGDLTSPDCLIAIDMKDDGERMSPCCCPEDAHGLHCLVCGGPLPCAGCLVDLALRGIA